jgi:hypothetical protein
VLGKAAVVIWCDVPPGTRREWEEWHSHEHMPERLSIPGFLRGTRFRALSGKPSYFVLYETRDLKTTTRGPYLRRLNHPTPWSRKMMPYHRNMVRSLCAVRAGTGGVIASLLATVRFSGPLPKLKSAKGITGAHLLAAQPMPGQTTEQKIRGADRIAERVILISGYDEGAVRAAARAYRALPGASIDFYRPANSLAAGDVDG